MKDDGPTTCTMILAVSASEVPCGQNCARSIIPVTVKIPFGFSILSPLACRSRACHPSLSWARVTPSIAGVRPYGRPAVARSLRGCGAGPDPGSDQTGGQAYWRIAGAAVAHVTAL